jgi:hypothetical protein
MSWVLIYWLIGMGSVGFTGQAYFETRELCEKAHTAMAKGAIRAVCLKTGGPSEVHE